jgi:hypothetical protein
MKFSRKKNAGGCLLDHKRKELITGTGKAVP